jgi:hypothetical protein
MVLDSILIRIERDGCSASVRIDGEPRSRHRGVDRLHTSSLPVSHESPRRSHGPESPQLGGFCVASPVNPISGCFEA